MENNKISDFLVENKETKLFLLGFLTLLLELILIRYLAGNIWNLGYFPNLVLMAVFVGMGIGFVFHHFVSEELSVILFRASAFILLFLVTYVHFKHPTIPGFKTSNGTIGGELFFASIPVPSGSVSYYLFFIWFFSIVTIFILISQRTAKIFRIFQPLKAYTLDIAGSCCGILCFMALSWFSLPAYVWFILLVPLSALINEEKNDSSQKSLWPRFIIYIPLIIVISIVSYQDTIQLTIEQHPDYLEVKWSPYQRVDYMYSRNGFMGLAVNGLHHQAIFPKKIIKDSFYKIPYVQRKEKELPPYKDVLIIGAGTGNDVVSALFYGAQNIDAVEIDPVIARFGEKYNPDSAYQDQRVKLIIDDGRSFITRTDNRYDLIIYALTDSLIKTSPVAQLRLENYLFTKESIERAYSLLKENGDLYLYNYYRKPWLAQKISQMIFEATGYHPQIVTRNEDFVIFCIGASGKVEDTGSFEHITVPTDDWPFLYLIKRAIPPIYLKAMLILASFVGLLMLILQITSKKESEFEKSIPVLFTKIAFVLMGVAFLLLETKSIVQFSLLFGTTWLNSSLVFLSVLLLVLAANWTAQMLKTDKFLVTAYILLIFSCLITLIYPLSNLLYYENRILRFVFATLLTFSPIYFANLIFSITFKNQKIAEHLFGWNLLGATLGGILEYSSMAFGYNSLTIIVAVCYSLVFVLIWSAQKLSNMYSLKTI
ncbi:MAG: hypothetical protein JW871_01980 [Endomicrobiales bacterium]|nr:hypothetical protein [Endomicrobiales bacterium]